MNPTHSVTAAGRIGGSDIKRGTVYVRDRELHAVAVSQLCGDLQGGVEVFSGVSHNGIEVPLIDKEIETKIVGKRQLGFNGAIVVALLAGDRLALGIGAARESVEVEVSKRTGPAVEIHGADTGAGLGGSES